MSDILDLSTFVRLTPASAKDIRARSRGRIKRNPLEFDLHRKEQAGREVRVAEPGGLYDPKLFGPLDSPDPSAFAHIELGAPIPHPVLDVSIDVIPLLPAAYRPIDERLGADLMAAYGNLYATSSTFARIAQLGAPEFIVAEQREATVRALSALLDNRTSDHPLLIGAGRRRCGSLADALDTRDPQKLEAVLFAMGWKLVAV